MCLPEEEEEEEEEERCWVYREQGAEDGAGRQKEKRKAKEEVQ